ncbi:MAG: 3-oxoadipyl-CoA thiolase [Candidatus Fluviicola riflensis]|nr:MAG: 3-oxoadipyl-CoA thiolase [Candidatus Fluviicola riflensis]OGS76052.1 MAG: 3-oxoadipyl-CoA thiolase [Candidatus Fluviicola riflensis]OGS81952.1 MAG: 3-oxoadipyl-CoA thiolase [Fluviicola sp. RIFCSPHIGHO2_01_FULL_43_53]OGS83390.1 MAG: 3-oxoadipyl-CoA thiolase [Fluviicola sp. RIFCSPHIGHO2_12_FULL_43_24]
MNKEAYLVTGVRTAIGNFGGTLAPVRTDDLAAVAIEGLLKKVPSLDLSAIEDVILGCANQAGEDNRNVARMAGLLAGLPVSVAGETVNRLCASGMSAAVNAARAIKDGAGDLYIAGGVENMTRGPWVLSKSSAPFGRDQELFDSSFGWRFINPKMQELYGTDSMGNTAENLAEMYSINREDQDRFALWSQQKATKAQTAGILGNEIVPVMIPRKKQDPLMFDKDEFMRPQTTMEGLGGLRAAFKKDGTVTAGNASGLNDGAAALLLASDNGLKQHNLQPIARIVSAAVAGVEPRIMGIGPVEASNKALKRAGLMLKDMDVIELNEAFAAQVLACTRNLGLADNDPRINPNGGAIALGHPLGMSGSRILLAAANELQRTNGKYALVTMCIGVGQGYATIIERT